MKKKKLTIMKWIFDIALIIAVSFMYYLNQPVNSPKTVHVPKGSIGEIITQFENETYSINWVDGVVLHLMGSARNGTIKLGEKQNTKLDFLYKMTKARGDIIDVTLIPGETTYIFLDQLAEQFGLDRAVLQQEYDKQAKYPEGEFVPNTYSFLPTIKEDKLIGSLLSKSAKQRREFMIKQMGSYDEAKWLRLATVASIVQKESASIEEMPLVASVIYNRIDKNMRLQMDGTLNYGKYSHVRVTHDRIKQDKSGYNTYRIKGLPDMPVCNVGFDALLAAIKPAKSNYLYFMKTKNGNHAFTCNYSTHLTNIKRVTD